MPAIDLKLSIIVPAYNCANSLPTCLEALLQACRNIGLSEILVVDDASSDDTAGKAARYDVILLTMPSNRGPAAARNLGASRASGDILVFVDADVAVAEDALSRIAAYFGSSPEAALIGSYDDAPAVKSPISLYRNLLHHFVHQNAPAYATHFWTGLGAVRKSVFDALGGFDEERFGRGCEDVELGYRLRANGYRIAVEKKLLGKHLKCWTLVSMVKTDLLIRAIPWTKLLLQYKNIPGDFSLGVTQRISVALAWLVPITLAYIPTLPLLPLAAILGFTAINWPFFKFLAQKEGWPMSMASVPIHMLYHFTSGLGFFIGIGTARLFDKTPPLI